MRFLTALAASTSLLACTQPHIGSTANQGKEVVQIASNPSTNQSSRTELGDSRGESTPDRPVAMLEGEAITLEMMRKRLFEQAGAETLRELKLEHALKDALEDASILIEDQALEQEEHLLLQRLSDDENAARRLLLNLRTNEGLGSVRYQALLWRNAALRALVQDDIIIGEPLLKRLHHVQHGPRVVVRLIVVSTLQEAEELHTRIEAGEPFDELAATRSIDSSRDRGGLIGPISLQDPAWPPALRTALEDTGPNEVTDIVFLENRFAIAHVDSLVAPDGVSLEASRADLIDMARLTQERIKMATLAGRLGEIPSMRVLDPTLRKSWDIDESNQDNER